MVCHYDMEDCSTGECEQYSIKSPIDNLTKSINVDLDEKYSWMVSKKIK